MCVLFSYEKLDTELKITITELYRAQNPRYIAVRGKPSQKS
jgi:hypothetical protein